MTDTATEAEADPQVQIEFGLWWPASDPEGLRDLADAWEAMAGAIDAAAEDLADHRGAVTGANQGAAVDAFARFLGGWTGSHLPEAAEHCRDLARACRDFAEAVDDARDTIRQLAVEIAASLAIGVGLAILTAGISAGAAAAVTAAAVARAGVVATSLAARVIAIVSRVVTFAGVGAFEAGATNLVIQTGRNAATNPNHDPFSGYDLEELGVSAAGGALFGAGFGGIRSIPLARGIESAIPPPRPPPQMLDDLSAPPATSIVDEALGGGRHSGFLSNYEGRSRGEIQRGVRSIERQIDDHLSWIDDPYKKISNWDNLDPRQQTALRTQKWPGDVQRQREQLEILRHLLQRGGS